MIKIICVGKIKESYFTLAVKEYLKRIGKYSKVEITEVSDYNFDISKTMYEEGKEILSKINDKDYVVTLEIDGNNLDSVSFSNFIDKNISNNITFVIGGSYGLSEEVKKRSNYKLSFSKMTFPHQLFRVVLLEQIYRSFRIINNESYHK